MLALLSSVRMVHPDGKALSYREEAASRVSLGEVCRERHGKQGAWSLPPAPSALGLALQNLGILLVWNATDLGA